jgi:hypothetical protein
MIGRALKLQKRIKFFCAEHTDEFELDTLSDAEWKDLALFHGLLKPFFDITIQNESHATDGMRGALWEALPAMEILLRHLEAAAKLYPFDKRVKGKNSFLAVCVDSAWEKLNEYYRITDGTYHSYAAATLLNPTMRKAWFDEQWSGSDLADYIPQMITKVNTFWEDNYKGKHLAERLEEREIKNVIARTFYKKRAEEVDNLLAYAEQDVYEPEDFDTFSPIKWWVEKLNRYPTVARYALDLLSCPAMSAECERVFSNCKLMITPNRCHLADDVIEAAECLRIWWLRGIIPKE